MKKAIALSMLLFFGCAVSIAQTTNTIKTEKIAHPKKSSTVATPVKVQLSSESNKLNAEARLIDEYLKGNELPLDVPKREEFSNSFDFKNALKQWVIDHPDLVKPHKRIISK